MQNFPGSVNNGGVQSLFQGCSVNESVRLENGNLMRTLNLISVPTIGPSLGFYLTYNSRSVSSNLGFGYGWMTNWQASIAPSSTAPEFTDDTGRVFTFQASGSDWVLDYSQSVFEPITLTSLPGSEWRISYFPDGEIMEFDSSGRLKLRKDTLGNAVSATYNGSGQLTDIEEQAIGVSSGRSISLSYASGSITITDPNSNSYVLTVDSNGNLTQISGPEGCLTSFSYATPSNHLITGRTDPVVRDPEEFPLVNQAWSYTFGSSGELSSVTDSRGLSVTYSYSTVDEYAGGPELATPQKQTYKQTTVVDARTQTWKYVFDLTGNLRRAIDPNFHQRRLFWSDESRLLYEASGFLNVDPFSYKTPNTTLGIRDQANMRFRRYVYDDRGNLRQSFDGNGLTTDYQYSQDRLVEVTPGRSNYSVQGEWEGHYGTQGSYLCGATGSSDVSDLPAYISAVVPGTGSVAPRIVDYSTSTALAYAQDPRCLSYTQDDDKLKARGCWKSSLDGSSVPYRRFQFTLQMASETDFNLSLYTCAVDQGAQYSAPYMYWEQSGYDVELLVTDSVGTQTCRINNNHGGAWVTFPLKPGTGDILVEVRARGGDNVTLDVIGDAVLSAMAFDAYENRTRRMTYNSAGQVTSVTGADENTTVYTYNSDGTLASMLEPGQTVAYEYTYGDAYKNLTVVTDPLLGETHMAYDLNGNVLTVEDADSQTSSFLYDGKNRMIQMTDALSSEMNLTFDAGGRLVEQQDQEGRVTQFAYKHNRLWKTTDALLQTMFMSYTNSGQIDQVTDWRGEVSTMVYDPADQLVEVQSPDSTKMRYALDSLGRVAAMTAANGNLSDVNDIVVAGAKNILFNPEAEEIAPHDPAQWVTPAVALKPRYWTPNTSGGARATESSGDHYFPLDSSLNQWEQKNVPASAGGRYLASFLARKEDSSSSVTSVRLEFQHQLHKDYPATTHSSLSSTIQASDFTPTSTSWDSSPRTVVEIPGDIQFSTYSPALASTRIKLTSGSAPLGVDKVQLQRLSTCLEYDGENLREICFADGARQRTEYDRLGRAYLSVDPDGRTVRREFDGMDRVVHVTDSLGNELFFAYDSKRDLVLFRLRSQGVDQDTEFSWDSLHRLTRITYPDATYEEFSYTAASDLETYRDNMARVRTLENDELHRLKTITYSDSSTVLMSYDRVGNLTRRDERNGDFMEYFYDDLNRLNEEIQYLSSGAQKAALSYSYNENGQLMSLSEGGAVYGRSRFGAARYGAATSVWSVPGGGRDEVGRLLAVQDQNSDQHDLAYDPEGRLKQLSHPNSVQDLYNYDIVGKLLDLQVKLGSTVLMEAHYGYNLSRDRLAQHTDLDCFTYLTDQAGRLVEEAHNRFCIHQAPVWLQGQWDRVTFDPDTLTMSLLPFEDTFAADGLQLDRWKPSVRQITVDSGSTWGELRNVGLEVRQKGKLQVAYPRAMGLPAFIHRGPVDNMIGGDGPELVGADVFNRSFGYPEDCPPRKPFQYQLDHAQMLQGDFDVSLDYELLEGAGEVFALILQVTPTDGNDSTHDNVSVSFQKRFATNYVYGVSNGSVLGSVTFAPALGQLRLARSGSTYTVYYRAQGASTWSGAWTTTKTTADVRLQLIAYYENEAASISVSNLAVLDGNQISPSGVFHSAIFDAGRVVSWDRIQWTESLPSGCDVELEVALANDYEDFADVSSPPVWFGPTGGGAFTTPAGEALPSGKTGRYAMVRATLTGTGSDTPTLSDIQLTCNTDSDTGSRVRRFLFDEAGNIRRITTVDDNGTTTDERDDAGWSSGDRINTLNQIKRQDVGGATWTFAYDLNGNMTEKTNGIDTWTYTWNIENRLTRVQGPSVDVSYTYDMSGRMQTRTTGGVTTTFTWDGMHMIRESTPTSTTTYLIPQGVLLGFVRDGVTYCVSHDALGSCRLVTDSTGVVKARFDHGAFGETLATSFDNVPGGMPYSWVGALGVRTDATTGLVYMRQRWYDPASLQRFISRDPIGLRGGANAYGYAGQSPLTMIDPFGLFFTTPTITPPIGTGFSLGGGAAVDAVVLASAEVTADVVLLDAAVVVAPEVVVPILGTLWIIEQILDEWNKTKPTRDNAPKDKEKKKPRRPKDPCQLLLQTCIGWCLDKTPACDREHMLRPKPRRMGARKAWDYKNQQDCMDDCDAAYEICRRTGPLNEPLGGWPPGWRGDPDGPEPPGGGGGGNKVPKAA